MLDEVGRGMKLRPSPTMINCEVAPLITVNVVDVYALIAVVSKLVLVTCEDGLAEDEDGAWLLTGAPTTTYVDVIPPVTVVRVEV